MNTDGLFNVAEFNIPVKTVSNGHPIRIVFFGDVHRDSPNHARAAWKQFLSTAKKLDNAYFFGMGDYLDSTSTSERACLGHIDDVLHETFISDMNKLQEAKVELLADELKFMRGRIIGLLGGNHYWKFPHGGSTDTELARALGCQYLGVSAFVRLTFEYCSRRTTLDVWAHHGKGAARTPGGDINTVDQMRDHAEADIYAMGHSHKRGVLPATPRLFLSSYAGKGGLRLRQRQQWIVRSGSFLASYEPGVRNYNVDAGRGPCSLGHVEIHVLFHQGHKSSDSLELHGYE